MRFVELQPRARVSRRLSRAFGSVAFPPTGAAVAGAAGSPALAVYAAGKSTAIMQRGVR